MARVPKSGFLEGIVSRIGKWPNTSLSLDLRRRGALSRHTRKVYLLIRGDDLYKDMSPYLAWRIKETPNIEVLLKTEVRRIFGDNHLSSVEIINNKTGELRTLKTPGYSALSGQCRGPIGYHQRSRRTKKTSCTGFALASPPTGPLSASRSCWKPAAPAYSPKVTCAPARSSVSPRPSAKARWQCNSCTSI